MISVAIVCGALNLRLTAQQDANGDPIVSMVPAPIRLHVIADALKTTVKVPAAAPAIVGGDVFQPRVAQKNPFFPSTTESGAKTYNFVHDGKRGKISINADRSVDVTIVNHFDENNLDELRQLHPKIADNFERFPKPSDDSVRIRLSLDIETTYSAMNEGQLENLYPKAYQIYAEHAKGSAAAYQLNSR